MATPILDRVRTRLTVELLRWSPKGSFSRAVGWLASRKVPQPIRAPLYRGFAKAVGADLDELDRPLQAFERFDEFFTRPLAVGLRPVDSRPRVIVSPVDGVVSQLGPIERGRLLQCKGRDYTVRGLLADDARAARFEGGTFCTIYLAPRNYHRIHSPVSGRITGFRHTPGAFYPVNPLSVTHIQGLFTINERLTTYLDSDHGSVALVKVAATGVGNMTLSYEPGVRTHLSGRQGRLGSERAYPAPLPIERGQEVAMFHLGSTVILLFEEHRVELSVQPGQPVKMGEAIGLGVAQARATGQVV